VDNRVPFIARFLSRRPPADRPRGAYSDKHDLHLIEVDGRPAPLVLAGGLLPETKTITEVRGERED